MGVWLTDETRHNMLTRNGLRRSATKLSQQGAERLVVAAANWQFGVASNRISYCFATPCESRAVAIVSGVGYVLRCLGVLSRRKRLARRSVPW